MSYTNVISLINAKTYLGVDDGSRDAEITRQIGAALRYVEEHSNHIVVSRDKKYYYRGSCVNVYDTPITAVVFPNPDTTEVVEKTGYVTYMDTNSENEYVQLTVGYDDPTDIPETLIEAAYIILKSLFYGEPIPMEAHDMLNTNKRFII